jgi:hypothetical protein
MGPVDAISWNAEAATLKVAGQTFNVDLADALDLEVGDYVVAGATQREEPAVVYAVGIPYVPGVSSVRVKAPIDVVRSATGTAMAGDLAIDYTPHLSVDPAFALSSGQVVELSGTQPTRTGVLVVNSSGDGVSFVSALSSAQETDRQ